MNEKGPGTKVGRWWMIMGGTLPKTRVWKCPHWKRV